MSGTPDAELESLWREHRPFLVDLAFRMLGNISDAEDVVQDAFGVLLRTGTESIDDIRAWMIVVVSRRCIDLLRSARVRHEAGSIPLDGLFGAASATNLPDPADRVTLDDSVRLALLVVLQRLNPAERAVFVLHDVFRFSFDAVAEIVGRTPAACRQLASRARRRIAAATAPERFVVEPEDQHRVAARFIAACAGGELDALLALLADDVAGVVDLGPAYPPQPPVTGKERVARNLRVFFGGATGTVLVSYPVNGEPGVLAFRGGDLVAVLSLGIRDGLIADLHAVADPQRISAGVRPPHPG